MEGKEKFRDLITSYLLNELDDEQRTYVEERIDTDPESMELFGQVKQAIKLVCLKNNIATINIDKELKAFEDARLQREHPEDFFTQAENYGNEVIIELNLKRRARVIRTISIVAIAASVLFALSWGLNFMIGRERAQTEFSDIAKKTTGSDKKTITRSLVNSSAKAENHILPDGTEVSLAGNSELSFQDPFGNNVRNIRLKGSANFKVAKDKDRPFTVFSNGISTTALGTIFTVTAFEHSSKIIVTLFEGKIVVKGVEDLQYRIKRPYYMIPGQKFVFDKKQTNTEAYVINASLPDSVNKEDVKKATKGSAAMDNPSMPKLAGSWFMFNNQSLTQVFEHLEKIYKKEIIYDKNDISKIYFIGAFNGKDSLEHILIQIASLNKLTVKKENNKFFITK
ncbi:MAG TPA: FecR family protein [Flavitalea sp.]|nr:FecR family protein [Flavitalea sp.]